MAYTIAYGDPVVFTGTLTITPIAHGDTATPVATPVREVRSTVELSSTQVNKYMRQPIGEVLLMGDEILVM